MDVQTKEVAECVTKAKAYIDTNNLDNESAKAFNSVIKITKGTTVITKSSIDKFTDCVPIRHYDISAYATPPSANTSGGVAGGGDFTLSYATVIVDSNADIGDTAGCFFDQNKVDIGILELSKSDGGFAVKVGYECKGGRVSALPVNYGDFTILIFWIQNISYVLNSFDETGKKKGKAAAGSFKSETGKAAAGG